MSSDEKPKGADGQFDIGEIPLRSSAQEFGADEMLSCGSCNRKSPPNRLDCMYCGADIEVPEEKASNLRPVIRPPEEDEPGFSLVCSGPQDSWNEETVNLAVSMTRLAKEDVVRLANAGIPVPFARGESEAAVLIAAERFREKGIKTAVYSDAEFEVEILQRRLRGISPEDDGTLAFILFNNDEVVYISPDDIVLIVVGLSLENRVEAHEKHKRKRLEKVLNTSEVSTDEVLIDIYTKESPAAFRIQAAGFDFSFLGDEKEMIAFKNLNKAVRFIREFAPGAKFDESYREIHSALDAVWPASERDDTKSIKRSVFGSFERKRVTTSSNLKQFTMYSRLRRLTLKFPVSEF